MRTLACCCLLALFASAAAACAEGPPPPASSAWMRAPTGMTDAKSTSPLEEFFPLVDGNVYLYQTTNEVGEPGVLVARVHREDSDHGELKYAKGAKRFAYHPDGVVLEEGGAYVLKGPLAAGTSWRGEHGGTSKILAVNVTAEVPAGKFEGCVQVLEDQIAGKPTRYATTFCKGIGVVMLEIGSGGNFERAELKSYAPPEDVGPDGTTKFQQKTVAPGGGSRD